MHKNKFHIQVRFLCIGFSHRIFILDYPNYLLKTEIIICLFCTLKSILSFRRSFFLCFMKVHVVELYICEQNDQRGTIVTKMQINFFFIVYKQEKKFYLNFITAHSLLLRVAQIYFCALNARRCTSS